MKNIMRILAVSLSKDSLLCITTRIYHLEQCVIKHVPQILHVLYTAFFGIFVFEALRSIIEEELHYVECSKDSPFPFRFDCSVFPPDLPNHHRTCLIVNNKAIYYSSHGIDCNVIWVARIKLRNNIF